jgi:hypothetical protein
MCMQGFCGCPKSGYARMDARSCTEMSHSRFDRTYLAYADGRSRQATRGAKHRRSPDQPGEDLWSNMEMRVCR